jgi:hypothetical protein
MSYSDEHAQLRARMKETADGLGIVVAWPNTNFKPNPTKTWFQFWIVNGASQQMSIGASQKDHRFPGIVVVQIFSVMGKGDGEGTRLADSVASAFRNWCGTTVRCKEASIKAIGPDGNGWYQINVSIPFHRDELL